VITKKRLARILSPPAEVDASDTGLRFTDILFGFVIFQLFLRLQDWGKLDGFVRWQLITGATLVLGSWIGFRRSLSRSSYQPKFFNLPFFRFVLDQAMVILYFRVAVMYPNNPSEPVDPDSLVHPTVLTLLLIFALYGAWDALGIWMAFAREGDKPKYGVIRDEEKTSEEDNRNWAGLGITLAWLAFFVLLYWFTRERSFGALGADLVFGVATGLLLTYRLAKDIRTSWRTP
jgi:hypothetical protein